jgi:RNA-binding protein YhbY
MVLIQKNKDPDKARVQKCILTDKSNTKLVKNINISEREKRITKNNVSKKSPKDIYVSDDISNDDIIEPIIQYGEEDFTNEIIKDVRSVIKDTNISVDDKLIKIKAINNKYDEHKKMYRTIKTSLKSITITSAQNKIFNIVSNMNKIVIHTYQFFKMYVLHHFHFWKEFPKINQYLIVSIMKTVAVPGQKEINKNEKKQKACTDKNHILKENLKLFYEKYYKPTMSENDKSEQLSYTGLTQMIEYEATDMITNISNHIQEHFENSMKKIINIYFDKNTFIEDHKNDRKVLSEFLLELNLLKEDIMTGSEYAMNEKHIKFKNELQKEVFNRVLIVNKMNEYSKNMKSEIVVKDGGSNTTLRNIAEENPLNLMNTMISMSIYSEKLGENRIKQMIIDGKENIPQNISIINCFPLRKSISPKYVTIDTTLILSTLNDEKKTDRHMLSNWKNIWQYHFNLDDKIFNVKGYKFARQLSTDGVGCSLLFIKEEYYKDNKAMRMNSMKKPKCYKEEKYVDQLTDIEKEEVIKLRLIGIDPGIIDLIAATDGKTTTKIKNNGKIFRVTPYYHYSNKEHIHETKSKIYAKKKLEVRKEKTIKIGNEFKSVEQIESELSNYNSNSCKWGKCIVYTTVKNRINNVLIEHYEEYIYRKHKWYAYINQQKAEQKMLKKFKEKMGGPKESAILIGDYDQKGSYMKGLPPTKGMSIRRTLRRAGYKVYLVNEYNTSCKLYKTGEDLIEFRGKRTPLALKAYNEEGLDLKNKNRESKKTEEFKSNEIIKRDLNGSLNILYKGNCILKGKEVPKYMQRPVIHIQGEFYSRFRSNSLNNTNLSISRYLCSQ